MKYIDAEKLIAEIERLKTKLSTWAEYNEGYVDALDSLLSFIESLEKEQEVDLEKEIERIIECEKEYMNFQSKSQLIKYIARHFYELGCRHTAILYDDIEKERQRRQEAEND